MSKWLLFFFFLFSVNFSNASFYDSFVELNGFFLTGAASDTDMTKALNSGASAGLSLEFSRAAKNFGLLFRYSSNSIHNRASIFIRPYYNFDYFTNFSFHGGLGIGASLLSVKDENATIEVDKWEPIIEPFIRLIWELSDSLGVSFNGAFQFIHRRYYAEGNPRNNVNEPAGDKEARFRLNAGIGLVYNFN